MPQFRPWGASWRGRAQHGAEGPLLPPEPPGVVQTLPGAPASQTFCEYLTLVSGYLGAAGAKSLGLRDGEWRGRLGVGSSSELSSEWGCLVGKRALTVTEDRPRVGVPSRASARAAMRNPEWQDSALWAGSQDLGQFWCC